jgi:hypothetical protein
MQFISKYLLLRRLHLFAFAFAFAHVSLKRIFFMTALQQGCLTTLHDEGSGRFPRKPKRQIKLP